MCTFQPRDFTGWGSEGVHVPGTGAVNMQRFVWRFLCTIIMCIFIHSFILTTQMFASVQNGLVYLKRYTQKLNNSWPFSNSKFIIHSLHSLYIREQVHKHNRHLFSSGHSYPLSILSHQKHVDSSSFKIKDTAALSTNSSVPATCCNSSKRSMFFSTFFMYKSAFPTYNSHWQRSTFTHNLTPREMTPC